MPLEPADDTCGVVDCGRPMADAVPLFRIRNEHGLHAVLEERSMELDRFGGWRAAVECAANIQRGRPGLVSMHDGAAVEILAAWVVVAVVQERRHEVRNVRDQVFG